MSVDTFFVVVIHRVYPKSLNHVDAMSFTFYPKGLRFILHFFTLKLRDPNPYLQLISILLYIIFIWERLRSNASSAMDLLR